MGMVFALLILNLIDKSLGCMVKILKKMLYMMLLVVLCSSSAWADSVSLSWHKERAAEIKGDNSANFSLTQVAFMADFQAWQSAQENLRAGVNITRSDIDWANSSVVDDSYYWLGIPLNYRQTRSANTEVHVRLEPGLMSTRDNLKKDSFFVNADVSMRFYYSASSYGQLGAIVDRSFGDANVYPLALWAFKPDNITEVKLGFPYSSVHAHWNSSFSTYMQLKPAGGLWLAGKATAELDAGGGNEGGNDDNAGEGEGDADGEGEAGNNDDGGVPTAKSVSDKIKYQTWQVAVGSRLHWRDGAWLSAEAGYLFERKFQALDEVTKPENTLFWQLGLTVNF